MPYLGSEPAQSALVAGDIADSAVTTAKINDGDVTTAKINDDGITLAKMAAGTDGNIISYDASGDPVAIATGSDGQVLTSTGAGSPPAFEAAPGGGLVFISNTDISSAATYDFTSFTAGSYEHYLFVLQNIIPATDNVNFYCLTSTDAGSSYDTGGSDYTWGVQTGGTWDTNGSAFLSLTGDSTNTSYTVGSTGTECGVNGTVWLHGPHTTSFTAVSCNLSYDTAGAAGSSWQTSTGGGARDSAADVDGFRFLFASGNIESGTITAYGVVNA